MSAHPGGTKRPRTTSSAAVCFVLLGSGLALILLADRPPLDLRLPLTGLALAALLVPAYVFADRVTLDFEVRGNAQSLTVSHLPLALGALLVVPQAHFAAGMTAAVLLALTRRQTLIKALYNLGATGFEIGVVTYAVSLAAHGPVNEPSLLLWFCLCAGLLVADATASLSLSAIWWLLRIPVPASQLLHPLLLALVTAVVSTVLTVVALSAAYTEPATLLLVLALAAMLTVGYRRHRRLVAQQATTRDLYAFVRDLGPVDVESQSVHTVLEQARLLLHAERLGLLARTGAGSWQWLEVAEGEPPQRRPVQAPTPPRLREPSLSDGDNMSRLSTPLFGSDGFAGLLTADGRLGDTRQFDLGDVQLLETVGAEVATALERGRLLADLQRIATTDPLTGLPTMSETVRLIDQALAAGTGRMLVAAVTVDSFREVNDTLGHEVGDALLLETAARLRRSHPEALLGRIGGGRFALAIPAVVGEMSAHLFGLDIRALVEGEARVGQVGTHVRLSVGVAQAPENATDAGTLLRRAETAMSSARHAHGGPVAWAPAYEVQGQRRLAVVTALREAIATGAIGLAYQPKVDLRTGRATGVEALARWTHPALGHVSPREFVPLAETSGAIGPLTSAVLGQAATVCAGWQRRAAGVGVSVNVSAQTVLDPSFVGEVAAVLTITRLAPTLLTLELTESVVVGDPQLAGERLGELRALGVRISVDDFGTGYSSLTYLKGLPVDEVKIDKGFIDGLGSDPADAAVVRAVVDIAHTLGVTVVAEGVEKAAQHNLLAALGVNEVQGYLHALPMPAQAMGDWLRQRSVSQPI